MARMVNFAGQVISVGLCWSYTNACGCLNKLASGFNVWTYFKNLNNFSNETDIVVLFKDRADNVLLALGCRKLDASHVTLGYKYATNDGSGNPLYLSDSLEFGDLQPLGFWSYEGSPYYHTYSTNGLYNDDEYRANLYFYDFDWSMNVIDFDGSAPAWYDGTMVCFNGYGLNTSVPEPLMSIEENQGMIYPDGSATIIPHIDKPIYKFNGQSTHHIALPDLLNNTAVEVIDSYEQDSSTTGGGIGSNYGYDGVPIDFWGVPGLSTLDTGFIRMYSPTNVQMRTFGSFLWSSNFIDNILKLMEDPIEGIIQVGIVPLDLSSYLGSDTHIYVGNVDTGVLAKPLTQQVIPVDMGSIDVKENWQNALDYAPFSKCELFLPMIGFVPLQINEVMDSRITLRYYVDLLSGDCVAALKVDKISKNGINLHSVMYHYRGNMLLNIPVTGKNYSAFYASIITSTLGAATGSPSSIASGVSNVLNSVPQMQKSGSFTGASGYIGCYKPYIAIDRPIQQLPKNYKKYVGYPAYIPYKLSALSGYTVVDSLIDNTVIATDTEKAEIERLLKEGVYL